MSEAQLVFDDPGEPRTPAVVFLNGFLANRSMWTAVIDRLGDHARCITCDLRGFGENRTGDPVVSVERHAHEYLHAALAQDTIDQPGSPFDLFVDEAGAQSLTASKAALLGMGLGIQGAQFVRVPHAGHLAPVDNREFFADALVRFLQGEPVTTRLPQKPTSRKKR